MLEIKRVPISVVDESTAITPKKVKEDKWAPVIEAAKGLPEGEALAITVDPIEGKKLDRVARTMQQNILHAGKRLNFEVRVRIHKEHHTLFVLPKPPQEKSNTGGIDTLAVKFGSVDNKIAILNLSEVTDEVLSTTLQEQYVGKPYGPNKGKLVSFLQDTNVAFVEVPKDEIPA